MKHQTAYDERAASPVALHSNFPCSSMKVT